MQVISKYLGTSTLAYPFVNRFGFGDTDPRTSQTGPPYVKLLSLTNETAAIADFTVTRNSMLANLPPQGNPAALAKPSSSTTSPPSPLKTINTFNDAVVGANESSAALNQSISTLLDLARVMLGLLGLCSLLLLGLVGTAIALLLKSRKSDTGGLSMRSAPMYQPVRLQSNKAPGSHGYDEPEYEVHRYDA